MDESKLHALDERLRRTLGSPGAPDFEQWRNRHAAAVAYLNPAVTELYARRRRHMQRIILFAATTAAAVCVLIGLSHLGTNGTGVSAFAQTVEHIQKAKYITWTTIIYERITSKDGQRHWYRTNVRKFAYKTPGLYRETSFDEKGNVDWVEITDAVHEKVLTLCPAKKIATMAEIRPPYDAEGPFGDAQRMLEGYDLRFIERRKTALGEVNIFRHGEGNCFFDCWIDPKNKQLVEYRINQGDNVTLVDYENDPRRNAEPEKESSGGTIVGSITNDIVFNAELDGSLFRFEVPKGYTIMTQKRYLVTEKEMLDYVRILVDFNGKVFPADISRADPEQLNKYRDMPKAKRPTQAQKLIETEDYYRKVHLRSGPFWEFLVEKADWDNFRYFGRGVELGNKDAIVCWYKPKDGKHASMYRVVYGDLSVKDVAAKDLPLPVGQ